MKKINIILIFFIGNFLQAMLQDEIYIIKKGDCLWKIAEKIYEDPFFWPKIWKNNTYIKNPHWIYPNKKLILPSMTESTTQLKEVTVINESVSILPKPELKPEVEQPTIIEKVKEIDEEYVSYVTDTEIPVDGEIINAKEDKTLLGIKEIVYVSVKNTEKIDYLIYEQGEEIIHPITQNKVGKIVYIKGKLRIIDKGKAEITFCVKPINIGDKLKLYSEEEKKEEELENRVDEGYIIGAENSRSLLGDLNIVFIDKGQKDGINKEDVFTIIRPETIRPGTENSKIPEQNIGVLKILRVQTTISTAKIIKAESPIFIGDKIKNIK